MESKKKNSLWQAALGTKSYTIEQVPFYNPDGTFYSYYFYVFEYEGEKCLHDYLQDTFEQALLCAWEDLGVPREAWVKVVTE